MEKIGYVLLLSMYLLSFTVGKNILNGDSMFESKAQTTISQSIPSPQDVIKEIGLDMFFDELTRGL